MIRLVGQGDFVRFDQRFVVAYINAGKQRLQAAVNFNTVRGHIDVFRLEFRTPPVNKNNVIFARVDRQMF